MGENRGVVDHSPMRTSPDPSLLQLLPFDFRPAVVESAEYPLLSEKDLPDADTSRQWIACFLVIVFACAL